MAGSSGLLSYNNTAFLNVAQALNVYSEQQIMTQMFTKKRTGPLNMKKLALTEPLLINSTRLWACYATCPSGSIALQLTYIVMSLSLLIAFQHPFIGIK